MSTLLPRREETRGHRHGPSWRRPRRRVRHGGAGDAGHPRDAPQRRHHPAVARPRHAYFALTPGLTKLVAPTGVFDLARDVPGEDTELVSLTTYPVSRHSLQPTVVPLLLSAAAGIADEENIFARRSTFPTPDGASLAAIFRAARSSDSVSARP
jgi:hypothetical protein